LALAAGCDGSHQHPLANVITGNAQSELMNYTDSLMPDREPRTDGILSPNDVYIGAADRCQPDAYDGFARARMWYRLLFEPELARRSKDVRLHIAASDVPKYFFLDCE